MTRLPAAATRLPPAAGPSAAVALPVALALLAGLAGGLLGAAPALADAPMTFHSERVELPTGDRTFPGGDSADAINTNCVTCHSAGMVLNQPALSRADWTAEVHKMANVYKAPLSAEDQAAIIDYLAATKGRP